MGQAKGIKIAKGVIETSEDQARLILLIRKIAREEIAEALDEHLCDYEHKELNDYDICPQQ